MELIRNIWKDRYNFALYISLAASVLNGIGLLTFGTEGSARNMLGALALFFGIAQIVLFLFPIVPICKARREHQNMQFIEQQAA